jgi:hypothetical protein
VHTNSHEFEPVGEHVTLAVGDRVLVDLGPDFWDKATVTAVNPPMATVQFDETIELPEHCGGGWVLVLDREIAELLETTPETLLRWDARHGA